MSVADEQKKPLSRKKQRRKASPTIARKRAYDKWIGKEDNREKLNSERREKYANDPEYRAKVLEKRKAYLEKNPRPSTKMPVPEHLVTRLKDFMLGRGITHSTIGNWVREGKLPNIEKFGTTYYLNAHQETVLGAFLTVLENEENPKILFTNPTPAMATALKTLWSNWSE